MDTSTRPTTYQMDRPTPSWQQCFHCDSVEASHRPRSLESDATAPADYALTTTIAQCPVCLSWCVARRSREKWKNANLLALTHDTPRTSLGHPGATPIIWRQLHTYISLHKDSHVNRIDILVQCASMKTASWPLLNQSISLSRETALCYKHCHHALPKRDLDPFSRVCTVMPHLAT